jgi:hypothetical protein
MVQLAEFATRFEADAFGAMLSGNGIPFIVKANDRGGTSPGRNPFETARLFVSEGDAAEAKGLLEGFWGGGDCAN